MQRGDLQLGKQRYIGLKVKKFESGQEETEEATAKKGGKGGAERRGPTEAVLGKIT